MAESIKVMVMVMGLLPIGQETSVVIVGRTGLTESQCGLPNHKMPVSGNAAQPLSYHGPGEKIGSGDLETV